MIYKGGKGRVTGWKHGISASPRCNAIKQAPTAYDSHMNECETKLEPSDHRAENPFNCDHRIMNKKLTQ